MHATQVTVSLLVLAVLSTGCSHPLGRADHAENSGESGIDWSEGYRIDKIINAAVALQAVDSATRAERLRSMARDESKGKSVFVLCRMLFEAAPSKAFRHPMLGGAVFLDDIHRQEDRWDGASYTYRGWPLEPIALWQGMPIVVVLGYELSGLPEMPLSYVEYCLSECRERKERFRRLSAREIRDRINEFLVAHPKFGVMRDRIYAQAGGD